MRRRGFPRRFRSLGPDERRAFLAALWEARGYETTVETDAGVVSAHRDGESLRIGVVGRWPRNPPEADLLVGTRDSAGAREAVQGGGRFVPPAEVRDLLLYGVESEVADRIAREHLGCSRSAVTSERTRDARVGLSDSSFGGRALSIAAVSLAVVAIVSLAGGAIVAGPLGVGGSDAGVDPSLSETPASTPGPESSGGATANASQRPRWVSEDTLANPRNLFDTHRDQLENRSYTLAVEYTKSPDSTAPVAPILQIPQVRENVTGFERVIEVDGRGRSSFSQATAAETANGTAEVTVDSYRQEANVQTRIVRTNGTHELDNQTYNQFVRKPGPHAAFALDMERLIADALSTDEIAFETVWRNNQPRYQVRATGDPTEWGPATEQYRAVAELTPDGRFVWLSVSYVDPETGEPVSLTVTITDVGTTDVTLPAWFTEPMTYPF